MIIIDTSVWINHFNGVNNEHTVFLSEYLHSYPHELAINGIIVQEVLQGARTDNLFHIYQIVLGNMQFLELDDKESAIAAAQLYRNLRKKGVTIRKPNDCLIAIYAIHHDLAVCHNDADFDRIAMHTNLKIWKS